MLCKSGSVVHESDPYCYVLSNKYLSKRCDFCFKLLTENKVSCKKCRCVNYCNDHCKHCAYRDVHDFECNFLKSNRRKPVEDKIRIWARLYIKYIKELYHEWHLYERGKYISIDYIGFPAEKMLTNVRYNVEYEMDYKEFKRFFRIKPELLQTDKYDFFRMYLLILYTVIKIHEPFESEPLGFGIYLVASLIPYKCKANAYARFDGIRLTVVAMYDMPQLNSITQLSFGPQAMFGFLPDNGKTSIKSSLDCSCIIGCKINHADFVFCQNPECNNGFLIQERKCPLCLQELSDNFIKHYIELRVKVFHILTEDIENINIEAEKSLYEEFYNITHPWNTLKCNLYAVFNKTDKRDHILYLETHINVIEYLHGYCTPTVIKSLMELYALYCPFCDLEKKLMISETMELLLFIVAGHKHHYYLEYQRYKDSLVSATIAGTFHCTCD